jgi:TadE-like protein
MRRRLRQRGNERGAVAVEAALVTPILLTLIIGIIEVSLLMRDHVAVSSAVRTGGRTASALADAGPSGVDDLGDCLAPCTGAQVPRLAQLAANAIQKAGSAMDKDSITDLWVYKANDKGYPGAAGSTTWTCTSNCIRYKWNPTKNQFRYYSGTWISSTISACANANPEAVGIYLKANHKMITGYIFSHDMVVEDHSVFSFEPLPTLTCASGTHI